MLLAGSWDESSEGDRLAIETLAGRPYREVVEVASRWRIAPDSPFVLVGSCWSLVSRDDVLALARIRSDVRRISTSSRKSRWKCLRWTIPLMS